MSLPCTCMGKLRAGGVGGRHIRPARAPLAGMTLARRAVVRKFVEALLCGNGVQPASRTPLRPSGQSRQSLHAQQDGASPQ
jgi:hypothetical protein